MTTSISNGDIYTDIQGLSGLKKLADKNSPEALRAVAQQFEAIFIQQIFQSMRNVKLDDGLFESDQSDQYLDMFDKQIAIDMARGQGIGLADVIYQQLTQSILKMEDENVVKHTIATQSPNTPGPSVDFIDTNENLSIDSSAKIKHTNLQPDQAAQIHQNSVEQIAGNLVNNPMFVNSVLARVKAIADYSPVFKQSGNHVLSHIEKSSNHLSDSSASGVGVLEIDVGTKPLLTDNNVKFDSPESFIRQLWPIASQHAAQIGVDPKVLLAQAALETGWGKNVNRTANGNSSHNLYNIKSDARWQGEETIVPTLEFHDGVATREVGKFRVYDSYNASFSDYIHFLQSNPRYKDALSKVTNAGEYVQALQSAGYATDPEYASKIMNILQNVQLENHAAQSDLKLSMNGTIQAVSGEPK